MKYTCGECDCPMDILVENDALWIVFCEKCNHIWVREKSETIKLIYKPKVTLPWED